MNRRRVSRRTTTLTAHPPVPRQEQQQTYLANVPETRQFSVASANFQFGPIMAASGSVVPQFEFNAGDNSPRPDTTAEDNNVTSCVLDDSNEMCDIVLEVEGKQLHTSRAVLAHYSPVFRRMLYSDFKEKEQKIIPLPEKQYSDMATFFNVMFHTQLSSSLVTDENIFQLLGLADEYEVDQVKVVCQVYIGEQLDLYFRQFYGFWTTTNDGLSAPNIDAHNLQLVEIKQKKGLNTFGATIHAKQPQAMNRQTVFPLMRDSIMAPLSLERQALIDKFLLYLHVCDQYDLPRYREDLKQMTVILCKNTDHALKSVSYKEIPPIIKVDFLEALCRKFDENQKGSLH